MLRLIAVIAASVAALACGTLPASAAADRIHAFSIPGVSGVRAWGSYQDAGAGVRITVCVKDAALGVYGAAVVGLAFDSSYRRHDDVSAAAIGYGHTQCQMTVKRYTGHLVVEALSGYENGKIRQQGKPRRIY
jgi:hypothetical protein